MKVKAETMPTTDREERRSIGVTHIKPNRKRLRASIRNRDYQSVTPDG